MPNNAETTQPSDLRGTGDGGPSPVLPPSGTMDLASAVRLAMAGVATALATDGANFLLAHNVIQSADMAHVVSYGSSIILAGATLAWAKLRNINTGKRLVAAAATKDPGADPKAPDVQLAVAKAIADPNSLIVAKP